MTNEQTAVLLYALMRDFNGVVTSTETEMRCFSDAVGAEIDDQQLHNLTIHLQGFAEALRMYHKMLCPPPTQAAVMGGPLPFLP